MTKDPVVPTLSAADGVCTPTLARARCSWGSNMLGDIPAALIQLVLATATKDSLRAVASTCTALWREARLAAKRSLILGSSAHPAQAGSASSSGTRETVHAETMLLHAETGCDPNLGQPPRAVAQGAVVVVSDCALLPDGTICVAACAPSKLVRMAPDGTVLGQVSIDGCWPRALAVTRAACFVTTMPEDVDTTEAPPSGCVGGGHSPRLRAACPLRPRPPVSRLL